MSKCPKCQAELTNLNSSTCLYCGIELPRNFEDDDLHLTDSFNNDDEFIRDQHITLPEDNDLGIESPAQLMETEALTTDNETPKLQSQRQQSTGEDSSHQLSYSKTDANEKTDDALLETSQIKKLSDDEIKEIEKNLYRSDSYINIKEKSELIQKLQSVDEQPFANTPISPHKKGKTEDEIATVKDELIVPLKEVQTESVVLKSKKKRDNTIYFFKNYIQVSDSHSLHPEDKITLNNREYTLQPKSFSSGFKIGALSGVLLILMTIVGSFLVGNSVVGEGQVVGIVLDEFDRPYIEGAIVKFADLGKTAKTNPQGFFILSGIPAGSHQVEYIINGKIVCKDYTTIADEQNSLIVLRPSMEEVASAVNPEQSTASLAVLPPVNEQEIRSEQQQELSPPSKTVDKAPPQKTPPTKPSNPVQKANSGFGKVTLAANVDGAKLKVDGNVLGAGNLTFSRVKSGSHTYAISKDGYESATGTFSLKPGENKTLSATLTPLTNAKKAVSYKTDDFFYSANSALQEGDYNTAISDFTSVVDKDPSNVDAFYGRGSAYEKLKKWESAHNDFVRAAEIYYFKKDINNAISCYNKAIAADDKSITAFLGRGKLFLDKGETRAALGDFDKVVKLDKRNFDGYFGMGEAAFKLQRYSTAIKHFKNAKSLDENNPLIYQYLSISYMFENDGKNTKKSLEQFLQTASENQKRKFQSDSRYSAVVRMADNL